MSKWSYSKYYDAFLGVFAMFMILLPKLAVFPFITFAVFVVLGVIKKKVTFKLTLIPSLFIGFYFMYAIYSLWTNNPHQAGVYLENKLSFLLLPLLFAFQPKEREVNLSITLYILAVLALFSIDFISSIVLYQDSGSISSFLASQFSKLHHPTYSSTYYMMGIYLVWIGYQKRLTGYTKLTFALCIGVFTCAVFLNLSLAGLLFIFGFVAFVILRWIYINWGKIAALIALIITPVILLISITSIPYVEGEWTNARYYAEEYAENPADFVKNRVYPMSGSEVRIVMWTASVAEIKEHPLGVGTGNVDDYLSQRLIDWNQPEVAKHMYNPHNQFLQTGLEIGIFGLLLLVLIVMAGVVKGIVSKNGLLIYISLLLAFNCLFESMLQRQSGIVFFTFFICFILLFEKQLYNGQIKKELDNEG